MKENGKNLALSFSGGGLSCLAYAGLYEVLQEEGISPSVLGGLSGGAIVAVLLASGFSSEEIVQLVCKITSWTSINTHLSKLEVLDHRKFIKLLRNELPYKNFEDLPCPVVVFATDLVNRIPVAINQGDIASAVVASCSVFPLLQPIRRNGKVLGDGGFTVYYGAQYLRTHRRMPVIGIDVTGVIEGKVNGLLQALFQQINSSITSNAQYELQQHPVDLDIRISFPSPSPLHFSREADHILSIGRQSARKHLREIKKAIRENS